MNSSKSSLGVNKSGRIRRDKSRRKSGAVNSTVQDMFNQYHSNKPGVSTRNENEIIKGVQDDDLDTNRKYKLFTFDDSK